MMQAGLQAYRTISISTMDRGAVLLALYEGAIGFLKQAKAAHERGDLERFSYLIGRSVDIIGELMASLDPTPLPRLAQWLERLYDFMLFELTEANLHRTAGPLNHVMELLGRVYAAYRQVILNPTEEMQSVLSAPVRPRR